MNNVMKDLMDVAIKNTTCVYERTNAILEIGMAHFPETDLRFDQNSTIFMFAIGSGYQVRISPDLNNAVVNVRVHDVSRNDIIAECTIDTGNGFRETYAKIYDKNLKSNINKFFDEISSIDDRKVATDTTADVGDSKELNEESAPAENSKVASDGTTVEQVFSYD